MIHTLVEPRYNIFVSYSAEDIHIVRPIAEQLMAVGLKVWFAEYEVLLSGRELFEKAICHGIDNCSFGICFTNDRYAQRKYCQMELQMLLDTLGPERIVEIRCPNQPLTYSKFQDLRKAHAFEYTNLLQALCDIQSATGYDTHSSWVTSLAAENRHCLSSHGLRYNLDFGGWEVKKHWFSWFGGGDHRVATYQRSWNGNTIRGHLIVGSMDIMRSSLTVEDDMDDHKNGREYYDRALKFAESFFQTNMRQKPIGVHLSFVPEHVSQSVVTTWFAPDVLSRLYSVVIPSYQKGCDIEFAFFFFYNGQINGFWGQAYLMDRLVHSLRVENSDQLIQKTNENRSGRYRLIKTINRIITFGQSDLFFHKWLNSQLRKDVLKGDLQSVRDLLNQGANPDAAKIFGRDAKGKKIHGTPLMVAAAEGLEKIVIELLAHGAQVNSTDSKGWTALLYASENGYTEICKLLLDTGADPNIKTAQLGTALMIATIKGHTDVVQLLLERGANASFRDSTGKAALDFAYKYGRSEIISILK